MKLLKTLAVALMWWFPFCCAQASVDLVTVNKSRRELLLIKAGKVVATYHVALGGEPVGKKQREGDQRTPEGRYWLDSKNAHSAYYKSFHISYPNRDDRANARKLRVSAGSHVMIHGQKNGYGWAASETQKYDWTLGCIALSNEDMDKMWQLVDAGTPILIYP